MGILLVVRADKVSVKCSSAPRGARIQDEGLGLVFLPRSCLVVAEN